MQADCKASQLNRHPACSGCSAGLPLAGGDGLRDVSVSRKPTPDRTKKELSINFKGENWPKTNAFADPGLVNRVPC